MHANNFFYETNILEYQLPSFLSTYTRLLTIKVTARTVFVKVNPVDFLRKSHIPSNMEAVKLQIVGQLLIIYTIPWVFLLNKYTGAVLETPIFIWEKGRSFLTFYPTKTHIKFSYKFLLNDSVWNILLKLITKLKTLVNNL